MTPVVSGIKLYFFITGGVAKSYCVFRFSMNVLSKLECLSPANISRKVC